VDKIEGGGGYFLGPTELFGGFCLVYRVPMVLAVHDVKVRKLLRGLVARLPCSGLEGTDNLLIFNG